MQTSASLQRFGDAALRPSALVVVQSFHLSQYSSLRASMSARARSRMPLLSTMRHSAGSAP